MNDGTCRLEINVLLLCRAAETAIAYPSKIMLTPQMHRSYSILVLSLLCSLFKCVLILLLSHS